MRIHYERDGAPGRQYDSWEDAAIDALTCAIGRNRMDQESMGVTIYRIRDGEMDRWWIVDGWSLWGRPSEAGDLSIVEAILVGAMAVIAIPPWAICLGLARAWRSARRWIRGRR